MGDPTTEAGHLQFARDVTYAGRRTQVMIGTGQFFMQCRDRASLDVECLSSFSLVDYLIYTPYGVEGS